MPDPTASIKLNKDTVSWASKFLLQALGFLIALIPTGVIVWNGFSTMAVRLAIIEHKLNELDTDVENLPERVVRMEARIQAAEAKAEAAVEGTKANATRIDALAQARRRR